MSQVTLEQVERAQQTVLGWMFHTSEHDTNKVSIGREGVGQLADLLHDWVAFKSKIDTLEAELTKEREDNQRLSGIEQALQDFTYFESTKASEVYDWLESVTGYRSEGNEPNEG